jgi:hypothetical protein
MPDMEHFEWHRDNEHSQTPKVKMEMKDNEGSNVKGMMMVRRKGGLIS